MASTELLHRPSATSSGQSTLMIDARIIPDTPTDIITGDADIVSISVCNRSGAASPKFTIQDKQGTPLEFIFGASTKVVAEGSVMFGPGPGMRATGGLTWSSDTTNALVGRIEYRRP